MAGSRWGRIAPWVGFSIIRIAFFAVPFAVMFALGVAFQIAAVLAAIIGLCLSMLFLHGRRSDLARRLERRPKRGKSDDEVEDAAVDAADGQNANAAPRPNA